MRILAELMSRTALSEAPPILHSEINILSLPYFSQLLSICQS